jgi:hypothetical protein
MSPRAVLQEGVEHPFQAACGGVVFQPLIGISSNWLPRFAQHNILRLRVED